MNKIEQTTNGFKLFSGSPPSPDLVADGFMLAILALIGFIFAIVPLLLAFFVSPRNRYRLLGETYECGMPAFGSAQAARFGVYYYLYALIFIVFEIDVLYLFPIAKIYREGVGIAGFIEIVIFIIILFLAVIYAWKKGVMQWEKDTLSLH